MTLLHFPNLPVPTYFPRCWTSPTEKLWYLPKSQYPTTDSEEISSGKITSVHSLPSPVFRTQLRNESCECLGVVSPLTPAQAEGRRVRFWCLVFSQVFRLEPPKHFPHSDTNVLKGQPSPCLCLHWQPDPGGWCKDHYLKALVSNIQLPTFSTSLLGARTNISSSLLTSSHHLKCQCSPHCLIKPPKVSLDTSMSSRPTSSISISFKMCPTANTSHHCTVVSILSHHLTIVVSAQAPKGGSCDDCAAGSAVSGPQLDKPNEWMLDKWQMGMTVWILPQNRQQKGRSWTQTFIC